MKTHCFYQWPSAHDVVFFNDVVYATVTHDPSAVAQWIHDLNSLYGHRLIVGLDVEWRPNHSRDHQNPAATLQLCVGRCCLIYQLIHSPYFPIQLVQFLSHSDHAFVLIEVQSDLEKLQRDHGIGHSAKAVDLRRLAVDAYRMKELKYAGLKTLARTVLGKEMEKPKRVTRSGWDDRRLTAEQVRHDSQEKSEEEWIIALDPGTEDYRLLPLPPITAAPTWSALLLEAFGGRLFCFYQRMFCYEGWVMNEYGIGESWTMLFSVEVSFSKVLPPEGVARFQPVAYYEREKRVLVLFRMVLFWVDTDTGSAREVRR